MLVQRSVAQRSAFQQPNGWSSTPCLRAHGTMCRGFTPPPGFFDTPPVVSKNDVHPCTSPLRGLVRRLRRCGRKPGRSKAGATTATTATTATMEAFCPTRPAQRVGHSTSCMKVRIGLIPFAARKRVGEGWSYDQAVPDADSAAAGMPGGCGAGRMDSRRPGALRAGRMAALESATCGVRLQPCAANTGRVRLSASPPVHSTSSSMRMPP